MAPVMSIEELESRQAEIRQRLRELDEEYAGQEYSDEARTEWDELNEELESNQRTLDQLITRRDRLQALAEDDNAREQGAQFQTPRPGATRGENIWDLSSIRTSVADPDAAVREMEDRAHRAIDGMHFGHERADDAGCREALERVMLTAYGGENGGEGRVANYILRTGSPQYRKAFGHAIAGRPLTHDQQRLLHEARTALGIGSTAGYAVPVQIDPTVLPTSNGTVNPLRRISRVVQTTVNTWKGVTSAGITASYDAEAAEVSDDGPTFAQPDVNVEKAQAFIPYSIEVEGDWGAMQSEMARLLQDAKDDLEGLKFLLGAGHGSTEPAGVVPGATTTVDSATLNVFAIADLYALEAAVPPRYRPRSRWVANRAIYQRVRQFDTYGGAALWVTLGQGLANDQAGNTSAALLGYPAEEASNMETSLATGKLYLMLGDFSRFLIVDRIGMTVEVVPHVVGANHRPTGQRGLYCYWRNSSDVLDVNAFRVLKGRA